VSQGPGQSPTLPDPGERLINRVASGADLEAFHRSGADSVAELRRTLAIAGRELESFSSALDFGCGCGRMLIWLKDVAASVDLHGTDIDADAIAWCREHLPHARCEVNGAEPPTAYADASFDLVYNHSVFTHIDERLQDLWLAELQRITRPGGLLVLSVHGEHAVPEGAWEIRDKLESTGIAYMDKTFPQRIGLPDWYQSTWHAPWYVFEHWQRWFRVRAYVPGAALGLQDHVLLERTEAPLPRPIRAGAGAGARSQAAGPAADRVRDALASLQRYQRPQPPAPGLAGFARYQLRTLLLRVLRPYTLHQDKFNQAVTASIEQLAAAGDAAE
jgi:SAM-dependent methyltransferase